MSTPGPRLMLAALMVLPVPPAHAADEIHLQPTQVAPRTWYFQGAAGAATRENRGHISNAGFVVTDEGVVVFDALGTPAHGRAMLEAIRAITPQPVRRVIVSHYHADHIYGLQPFKAAGAEIWAHRDARAYLDSDEAKLRLAQRRELLAPWVDANTRVLPADRWLEQDESFTLGGVRFEVIHAGPAHSAEDLMLLAREEGVLFAGDLFFTGRVPFVGNADSRGWLAALDRMLAVAPKVVVPGHGAASRSPDSDILFTRDYLRYLRGTMGEAVANLEPFDEAYAKTDWSRYRDVPAFDAANRINAYGTYLLLEQETLKK